MMVRRAALGDVMQLARFVAAANEGPRSSREVRAAVIAGPVFVATVRGGIVGAVGETWGVVARSHVGVLSSLRAIVRDAVAARAAAQAAQAAE